MSPHAKKRKPIFVGMLVSLFVLLMLVVQACNDSVSGMDDLVEQEEVSHQNRSDNAGASDVSGDNQGDVSGADGEGDEEDETVEVCHVPPGNPSNAHTLTVGAGALPAHLAHGDTEGPCDDGDGE